MQRLRSRSAIVLLTLAVLSIWPSSLIAIRGGDTAVFGPVGITRGQLLRVNVAGIGNPNDMPWTFQVRVLDASGRTVLERRLDLGAGATGFVDVRFSEGSNGAQSVRRTLRAEVVGFNPQPDPPQSWVATLEVIDLLTGRTSVLLGGPDTVGPR